jgi:cell division protein ZapB
MSHEHSAQLARCGHANTVARIVDPQSPRLYIRRMNPDQSNHRFDLELRRLEKRLEELVTVCRHLQEENKSLRQRQDTLMAERASLLQKNEQVRGRVEAMIGRLKGMEQVS